MSLACIESLFFWFFLCLSGGDDAMWPSGLFAEREGGVDHSWMKQGRDDMSILEGGRRKGQARFSSSVAFKRAWIRLLVLSPSPEFCSSFLLSVAFPGSRHVEGWCRDLVRQGTRMSPSFDRRPLLLGRTLFVGEERSISSKFGELCSVQYSDYRTFLCCSGSFFFPSSCQRCGWK